MFSHFRHQEAICYSSVSFRKRLRKDCMLPNHQGRPMLLSLGSGGGGYKWIYNIQVQYTLWVSHILAENVSLFLERILTLSLWLCPVLFVISGAINKSIASFFVVYIFAYLYKFEIYQKLRFWKKRLFYYYQRKRSENVSEPSCHHISTACTYSDCVQSCCNIRCLFCSIFPMGKFGSILIWSCHLCNETMMRRLVLIKGSANQQYTVFRKGITCRVHLFMASELSKNW